MKQKEQKTVNAAATDDRGGWTQQGKSKQTNSQLFPNMENKDSDRSAKEASNEENKVYT